MHDGRRRRLIRACGGALGPAYAIGADEAMCVLKEDDR